SCQDYAELHAFSLQQMERFWSTVWRFCGVVGDWDSGVALVDAHKLPGARFFPGARLNFAENLLRRRDDHQALVFWNEQGRQRDVSYAALYDQVRRLAARLRSWGLEPGDRVAGYLPNLPETVIAMLATTSIGAVWTSCSPDFGLQGVLDRFGQVRPRVLFAASSYLYNGKRFDYVDRVRATAAQIDSIEKVVLVPYLEEAPAAADAIRWSDCLDETPSELTFEQLPFDHPVYILYSSGTTGKPKCIIHGAGGTLVQHLKEHVLHTDLKPSDRMVYFTTCGWMMWNWLVSGLATGAKLVLYDGSPMQPGPAALFDLTEAERVTVFGTSAKYISALEKAGVEPKRTHNLS
ncbi:MAG: AMP-binding protein, partial [bacterium]|nr:AMP-binding protein [bacterium]